MNRNEIESEDPHSLIEGMLIGGYLMGASEGIVYVRAEYPSPYTVSAAPSSRRKSTVCWATTSSAGISTSTSNWSREPAHSSAGRKRRSSPPWREEPGRPRPRPPFPAQKGLWGMPTNINNIETWYNVPPIMAKGAEWFNGTGSPKSPGTKVFSLVGKVRNTGLVEMPLGTPLKTFIYDVGEGGINGKQVKSVQTGGASGGCIPQEMFDTPVDYETLGRLGSIMGSGGMVVMDEDNCMVDVARYFIEFTHSESCGKCVMPRRASTRASASSTPSPTATPPKTT